MAISPDGELIAHESGSVREIRTDRELFRFSEDTFGSFVVVHPDHERIFVGESSRGTIRSVPIAGGDATLVDSIVFNYDLAFDEDGNGYVSAPDPEFVFNQVYLVDGDPSTPSPAIVIGIPGFSGPLAMHDGFLYYGTARGDGGAEALARFSPAQLAAARGGTPIAYVDGQEIFAEASGFNSFAFVGGTLYYSDLGFNATPSIGRIWSLDVTKSDAPSAFVDFPIAGGVLSPTYLAFRPGTHDFAGGVGPDGGSLFVAYSDFASVAAVAAIRPGEMFVRGETNGDGSVDIADALTVLNFLFADGAEPSPRIAADINGDDRLDISDAIYLLEFLFGDGPDVPEPHSAPGCG